MSKKNTVTCQDDHVTAVASGSAIAKLMDWRAAHGYDPRLLPGHFCKECQAAKKKARRPPKPARRGKYAEPPAEPENLEEPADQPEEA